jgi:hypothetical protein
MLWTLAYRELLKRITRRRNLHRESGARNRFRPQLERLESRLVPAVLLDSPADATLDNSQVFAANADSSSVAAAAVPPPSTAYFTDGNNRLWKLSNGAAAPTAAFATRLSAGHDSAGNEQLYFTDGNNKLWICTNAGQFIQTAAFATRISAGNGQCFLTDGNNRLCIFNDATNLAVETPGFATRLSAGRDTNNADQVYFTDGNNEVFRCDLARQITDMHVFASRIAGGTHEVFFTDGNDRLWTATDFNVNTPTGTFATRLSAGPDANNTDLLYFTDATNKLNSFQLGHVKSTPAFAKNVAAGTGFLALTDGANKVCTSDETGNFNQTAYFAQLVSVP